MNLKRIFPSLDISGTGMRAQRRRMTAIASNIANAETTRTEEGGPYRRRVVVMREGTETYGFKEIFDEIRTSLRLTNPRHRTMSHTPASVSQVQPRGVESEEIEQTDTPPRLVYDPHHPDADADGYVAMPNINVVREMVDMMLASRAYEANVAAVQAAKEMAKRALEI